MKKINQTVALLLSAVMILEIPSLALAGAAGAPRATAPVASASSSVGSASTFGAVAGKAKKLSRLGLISKATTTGAAQPVSKPVPAESFSGLLPTTWNLTSASYLNPQIGTNSNAAENSLLVPVKLVSQKSTELSNARAFAANYSAPTGSLGARFGSTQNLVSSVSLISPVATTGSCGTLANPCTTSPVITPAPGVIAPSGLTGWQQTGLIAASVLMFAGKYLEQKGIQEENEKAEKRGKERSQARRNRISSGSSDDSTEEYHASPYRPNLDEGVAGESAAPAAPGVAAPAPSDMNLGSVEGGVASTNPSKPSGPAPVTDGFRPPVVARAEKQSNVTCDPALVTRSLASATAATRDALLNYRGELAKGARKLYATLYQSCQDLSVTPVSSVSAPGASCRDVTKNKPIFNESASQPRLTEVGDTRRLDIFGEKSQTALSVNSFLTSLFLTSGMRLKANQKVDTAHGITAQDLFGLKASDNACVGAVQFEKAAALVSGDIFVNPRGAIVFEKVGQDPFGIKNIKIEAECDKEFKNQNYEFTKNFDFTAVFVGGRSLGRGADQSSPAAMERVSGADLKTSRGSIELVEQVRTLALTACHAQFKPAGIIAWQPANNEGAGLFRSMGSKGGACVDKPVELAGQDCVARCMASRF